MVSEITILLAGNKSQQLSIEHALKSLDSRVSLILPGNLIEFGQLLQRPDIQVILSFPSPFGLETFDFIAGCRLPVILVSEQVSLDMAIQAMRRGAYDILQFSPADLPRFLTRFKSILEHLPDTPHSLTNHSGLLIDKPWKDHILEVLDGGIAVTDAEENFIYANPAADELFGVEPGGLINRNLAEFTTTEQFHALRQETQRRKLGEKSSYDFEITTSDGQKRSILLSAVPLMTSEGRYVGALGNLVDITHHKAIEKALLLSENRYRSITETIPSIVYTLNPDMTFDYISPPVLPILGFTQEDVRNTRLIDLVHPDDQPQVQALWNAFQKGIHGDPPTAPEHQSLEVRVRRKDGSYAWMETRGTVLANNGHSPEILGVGSDITSRRLAEELLRADQSRLNDILQSSLDLISMHNSDGLLSFLSPSVESMLGYSPDEILGRDPFDFVHPDDRKRLWDELHSSLLNGSSDKSVFTYQIQQKSGAYLWVETLAQFSLDSDHKISRFVCTTRDISNRRRMEDTLFRRLKIEELVARIANQFIRVTQDEIDPEIYYVLDTLGNFMQVDQAYLVLLDSKQNQFRQVYMWNYDLLTAPPSMAGQNLASYPWAARTLRKGDLVQFSSLDELPDDAHEERLAWGKIQVQSMLACPLIWNNLLQGFLGFSKLRTEKQWAEEDVNLVSMISSVFINLLTRRESEHNLIQTQVDLAEHILEIERRNEEISLLAAMSSALQQCAAVEDTYPVIASYAAQIFPDSSGALMMIQSETNELVTCQTWGKTELRSLKFKSPGCWALQSGRMYLTNDTRTGPVCQHITPPIPSSYMCMPILARNTQLGVIHLRTDDGAPAWSTPQTQIASAFAEQIGLACYNLQLLARMQEQAVRDSLTGLFNRYYLETSLETEIARSNRSREPLSVIMFDIDHFKSFNDRFGHPTGDRILSELGALIKRSIRAGDIACRYGGEEFFIIMPKSTSRDACHRAEQLRLILRSLSVNDDTDHPCSITVSIGVAEYPTNGHDMQDLLKEVDTALYRAKLTRDSVYCIS